MEATAESVNWLAQALSFVYSFFTSEDLAKFMTSLSSFVVAIVALKGLSTWKKQLAQSGDHELARRVLAGLVRYNHAISDLRNPVTVSADEDWAPDSRSSFHNVLKNEYQRRFAGLNEQRSLIKADLEEGEAAWGKPFKDLLVPIRKLRMELTAGISVHIESSDPRASQTKLDALEEIRTSSRDVVHAPFNVNAKDEFREDMDSAIDALSAFLRNKLVS